MQSLLRAAACAALALPLAIVPASAQNYQGSITPYAGGVWFSDFNDGAEDFDTFDEDFDTFSDFGLDAGWITGLQAEYWLPFMGGRFGLRANGSYTNRPFEVGDNKFGDVNTWFGNGSLLFRLLTPRPDRMFAPYLALGAGVVHYNPAGDGAIVVPTANAIFGDVDFDPEDGDFDIGEGNSETEFAINFGIGTDIIPEGWDFGPFGLGLRLEVMDHYALDSPARPIDPLFFDPEDIFEDEDQDYSGVHNLRYTAGLLMTFGELFADEPTAVAPAPPPPPAPEPEPDLEEISICVVDPTLDGELTEVDALYDPMTGDTVVVINGNRVDFETEFPTTTPLYIADADWHVRGEPITLNVAGTTTEFVTFGGPRLIDASELTLLGFYQGTPIYADEEEVEDFRADLEDALDENEDLEEILEENAELRAEVSELDVVYAPLEPGCVFQAFRMVEEVRKVRG